MKEGRKERKGGEEGREREIEEEKNICERAGATQNAFTLLLHTQLVQVKYLSSRRVDLVLLALRATLDLATFPRFSMASATLLVTSSNSLPSTCVQCVWYM